MDAAQGTTTRPVRADALRQDQPWSFALTPSRIDVFADPTRALAGMDPLRRAMYHSLGCAVENLVLAGPRTAMPPPSPSCPTRPIAATSHASTSPTTAPISPLFAAIPNRHTDRSAYNTTRPVDPAQLTALGALVDVPGTGLV